MPDLVNEFSWSRSRDNLFQECRRKYFYHYYGAWGGWEPDASEAVRALYVLKQLSSRQQWAGKTVHEAVEWALRALSEGRELPESWLVDETIKRMRREWKASHDKQYWQNPKGTALFEHEYGVAIKPQEWQLLRDHVARCLRNFYRLDLLTDIRQTPRERWVMIEEIRAFDFEGTPVYGAPDFAYWTREGREAEGWGAAGRAGADAGAGDGGRLALVDWKTGGGDPKESGFQLGIYALYAREVLKVEPQRVDLVVVNLREPKESRIPWDDTLLEEVKERFRLSVRSMKAWLRDPLSNLAAMEDFEKTEDPRLCRRCNFRSVCRPELSP